MAMYKATLAPIPEISGSGSSGGSGAAQQQSRRLTPIARGAVARPPRLPRSPPSPPPPKMSRYHRTLTNDDNAPPNGPHQSTVDPTIFATAVQGANFLAGVGTPGHDEAQLLRAMRRTTPAPNTPDAPLVPTYSVLPLGTLQDVPLYLAPGHHGLKASCMVNLGARTEGLEYYVLNYREDKFPELDAVTPPGRFRRAVEKFKRKARRVSIVKFLTSAAAVQTEEGLYKASIVFPLGRIVDRPLPTYLPPQPRHAVCLELHPSGETSRILLASTLRGPLAPWRNPDHCAAALATHPDFGPFSVAECVLDTSRGEVTLTPLATGEIVVGAVGFRYIPSGGLRLAPETKPQLCRAPKRKTAPVATGIRTRDGREIGRPWVGRGEEEEVVKLRWFRDTWGLVLKDVREGMTPIAAWW